MTGGFCLIRAKDRLTSKFANLYCKKIKTGDPLCPPDVKPARRIWYKMTESAYINETADAEELLSL